MTETGMILATVLIWTLVLGVIGTLFAGMFWTPFNFEPLKYVVGVHVALLVLVFSLGREQ